MILPNTGRLAKDTVQKNTINPLPPSCLHVFSINVIDPRFLYIKSLAECERTLYLRALSLLGPLEPRTLEPKMMTNDLLVTARNSYKAIKRVMGKSPIIDSLST